MQVQGYTPPYIYPPIRGGIYGGLPTPPSFNLYLSLYNDPEKKEMTYSTTTPDRHANEMQGKENKRDIFSRRVSIFSNITATRPEGERTLWEIIEDTRNGKNAAAVEAVRATAAQIEQHAPESERYQQLKKQMREQKQRLPCFSPSCVISGTRCKENVQTHSRFICLDFDKKDNTAANFSEFKQIIAGAKDLAPFVAFAAVSCSGAGFFALLPILAPERHRQQYEAAVSYFAACGLYADTSCKDPARLRFITHDPAPYINAAAVPFGFVLKDERAEKSTHRPKPQHSSPAPRPNKQERTLEEVAAAVQDLKARGVDITDSYADWQKIAFAFAAEFGEEGRGLFHELSAICPKYDRAETEQKYDEAERNNTGAVKIGTFYHLYNKTR